LYPTAPPTAPATTPTSNVPPEAIVPAIAAAAAKPIVNLLRFPFYFVSAAYLSYSPASADFKRTSSC